MVTQVQGSRSRVELGLAVGPGPEYGPPGGSFSSGLHLRTTLPCGLEYDPMLRGAPDRLIGKQKRERGVLGPPYEQIRVVVALRISGLSRRVHRQGIVPSPDIHNHSP